MNNSGKIYISLNENFFVTLYPKNIDVKKMKKMIKYIMVLITIIVFMASSCNDKDMGWLFIRNNSDQIVYYWYAHWIYDKNHTNYHYPDTILPSKERIYSIWPVHPNVVVCIDGTSRHNNWEKIFSELPEGKFSVYFFNEHPKTQEAWDIIRENYNLYRKDVTFQEIVDNDYIIDYP